MFLQFQKRFIRSERERKDKPESRLSRNWRCVGSLVECYLCGRFTMPGKPRAVCLACAIVLPEIITRLTQERDAGLRWEDDGGALGVSK
jgi:hypothetical protein